eukprot:CAMPEP_0118967510 /NCGR_PEP_ID=MMETSP1173-20130426/4882_1 /TAXON_ID=1034831 /ORGANISM="Rhizochromulina marina cf, Strain CCMP1243" /LENGTH=901 /DNA_ID=CAMNT_0006916495 /DNA_START=316 /DNA_END=3021 /DNA_ORIENTATION=+
MATRPLWGLVFLWWSLDPSPLEALAPSIRRFPGARHALRWPRRSVQLAATPTFPLSSLPVEPESLQVLGHGTYGAVYQTQELVLKRTSGEASALKYWEREELVNSFVLDAVRQAAPGAWEPQVLDRHVAPFLGTLQLPNATRYLVWRHCGGHTLKSFLEAHSLQDLGHAIGLTSATTPMDVLQEVASQLGQVLAALHHVGITYRDLKPENVVVDTDSRCLRLIDFGSASLIRKGEPNEDDVKGVLPCTPSFAPPDTYQEHQAAPFAFDVYSLAMVLAYCAMPHLRQEASTESVTTPHVQTFSEELAEADFNLDGWLQGTIARALLPVAILEGLAIFNGSPGKQMWKLLGRMLRKDPQRRITMDGFLSSTWLDRQEHPQELEIDSEACMVGDMAETLPELLHVELSKPFGLLFEESSPARGHEGQTVDHGHGVHVVEILEYGSARSLGAVQPGDQLLEVDGTGVADWTFEEVMHLLRFQTKSRSSLVFARGHSTLPSSGNWLPSLLGGSVSPALDSPAMEQIGLEVEHSLEEALLLRPLGAAPSTTTLEGTSDLRDTLHLASRPMAITPSGAQTSRLFRDRASIAMQGHRKEMEDTVLDAWFWTQTTSSMGATQLQEAVHVAGVFDGHCGDTASAYAAAELLPILRRHFDRDHERATTKETLAVGGTPGDGSEPGHDVAEDVSRALSALERSWRELCDQYTSLGAFAGTTACVAMLVETAVQSRDGGAGDFAVNLLVLNCGDSRAIFVQPEESGDGAPGSAASVRFSTIDHSMEAAEELARVEKDGGVVDCRGKGQPRLVLGEWRLALPRAMTHRDWLGAGVSDTADLYSWPLHLSGDHAYQGTLVIASDGVWGSLSREEAAVAVSQCRKEGYSAKDTAKRLCQIAEKQGSKDNMGAVVWFL